MSVELGQNIDNLGDAGFLPVILPNKNRTIHGWLMVNQTPNDPDAQILFVNHLGGLTVGVIELASMDDPHQDIASLAQQLILQSRIRSMQIEEGGKLQPPAPEPEEIDLHKLGFCPDSDIGRIEIMPVAQFREHILERDADGVYGTMLEIVHMPQIARKQLAVQSTQQLRARRHGYTPRDNRRIATGAGYTGGRPEKPQRSR